MPKQQLYYTQYTYTARVRQMMQVTSTTRLGERAWPSLSEEREKPHVDWLESWVESSNQSNQTGFAVSCGLSSRSGLLSAVDSASQCLGVRRQYRRCHYFEKWSIPRGETLKNYREMTKRHLWQYKMETILIDLRQTFHLGICQPNFHLGKSSPTEWGVEKVTFSGAGNLI